jgi:hypothetical protein
MSCDDRPQSCAKSFGIWRVFNRKHIPCRQRAGHAVSPYPLIIYCLLKPATPFWPVQSCRPPCAELNSCRLFVGQSQAVGVQGRRANSVKIPRLRSHACSRDGTALACSAQKSAAMEDDSAHAIGAVTRLADRHRSSARVPSLADGCGAIW